MLGLARPKEAGSPISSLSRMLHLGASGPPGGLLPSLLDSSPSSRVSVTGEGACCSSVVALGAHAALRLL